MNAQDIASGAGACGACRHANHGTMDADEGLWACPWLGPTSPEGSCRIAFADTGRPVFEPYDGTNGTWRSDAGLRSIPEGYEGRKIIPEGPAGRSPADSPDDGLQLD